MKWHHVIFIGLLGLALVLHSTAAVSSFLSNRGLIEYLKLVAHDDTDSQASLTQTAALLHKAVQVDAGNVGAHRGLGFIAWYNEQDPEAFMAWQHVTLTTQDYIVFGRHAADRGMALRWYALAERLEPDNPELWLEVGQLCQYDNRDAACARFLSFNHHNWLVDSDFAFGRAAWRFNRREGADYAITDCPNLPAKKCALVRIDTVTSSHGTSWHQCLVLEPGRRYRFSAWIRAETEGQWIPLYFQGSVDGAPNGHTLAGIQTGAQEWEYWERVFTAPVFDQNRACFHPVRLLDVGQAWFHSAALRLVKEASSDR